MDQSMNELTYRDIQYSAGTPYTRKIDSITSYRRFANMMYHSVRRQNHSGKAKTSELRKKTTRTCKTL
jgi:hypothetical protein